MLKIRVRARCLMRVYDAAAATRCRVDSGAIDADLPCYDADVFRATR